MFESFAPTELIDEVTAAARVEAQAIARRLNAVADLMALRERQYGDRPEWAADLWDAVAAELAAALRICPALASGYLRDALVLRERLPKVGHCLASGEISYTLFQTIAYRTALITDEKALARVDSEVAARAPRWPSLTQRSLAMRVDNIIAKVDRDAVRRTKKEIKDRYLNISESEPGMAEVYGKVFASTGGALNRRLDELAGTVCEGDPRTKAQRRADALGALVAGADRLACTCGEPCCSTTKGRLRDRNVVIYVIAEHASLDGSGTKPGFMACADGLVPTEVIAELAKSATLRPLSLPVGAQPERGYIPSAKLIEFVRCRDLTCRAPGCSEPAMSCDVDHTIPYADGGPTHASNLKCLCRKHHLLKTFWQWKDKQLPDGTVIWTLPSGHTYVTTPGSAVLFPALTVPTGDLPDPAKPRSGRCGKKTAMMPTRRRTRAQERSQRIAAERNRNHNDRLARQRAYTYARPTTPGERDEPPPF
jgi:hypothetical protein